VSADRDDGLIDLLGFIFVFVLGEITFLSFIVRLLEYFLELFYFLTTDHFNISDDLSPVRYVFILLFGDVAEFPTESSVY